MRISGYSGGTLQAQANLAKANARFSKSVENLAAGGGSDGFAAAAVDLKVSQIAAESSVNALKVILDAEEQLIGALLDQQG